MALSSKIFWFDCETTGLDPARHSIVQLAGLVEIDHVVVEQVNFKCKPTKEIDPRALEVQGRTEEEVMGWPEPKLMLSGLRSLFDKYVDKFNPNDFLIPAGQNVGFDLGFLHAAWPDKYLGSYLKGMLCLRTVSTMAFLDGKIKPVNEKGKTSFKLRDLCVALAIEPGTHDALTDIIATRACFEKLTDRTGLCF